MALAPYPQSSPASQRRSITLGFLTARTQQHIRISDVLPEHRDMENIMRPDQFGGKATLYANLPTLWVISNGPINRGLSFPFFSNRITLLMGDILRNTRSPTLNSNGHIQLLA